MEGAGLNYKKLVTAMSVMTLAAVYTAACIALPRLVKNPGQGIRTRKDVYSNADAESEDTGIKIDFTKKTVVIDSGHGGIDPGKKSDNGILEKDVNLSIAKKLQKKLIDTGFNVVMTREDENGLYSENDDNKKIADMKKRCQIIKDSNADIVVSIHQNSFQSQDVKGAQVFYYKHSVEGKKLAEILQASFKENLDSENKRVEKADSTYYMLVHTSAPTVIAECGFLSNPTEASLLNSSEYQQKIAEALYKGIINYFCDEKHNN